MQQMLQEMDLNFFFFLGARKGKGDGWVVMRAHGELIVAVSGPRRKEPKQHVPEGRSNGGR